MVQTGLTGAIQDLTPYLGSGAGAIQTQAALSGALGPQIQAQAYQNFQSSPGQQYLREQAEQALLRNASAIGGLGGGNVRQELQRQAMGLAQQDYQNQFANLGSLAQMGAGAAGQAANLRTRAGEQIAGNVANTTSALANLVNQQGQGLANILGGATGNISNLLTTAGTTQGQSAQNLATILANIATQQGSQAASLPSIPGVQQTPGILGGLGQLAGGVGGLLAAI